MQLQSCTIYSCGGYWGLSSVGGGQVLKMQCLVIAVPIVLQHFCANGAWPWLLGWLRLLGWFFLSGKAELLVGEWFGNRV